jgi:shikimate kinase
MRHVYLIGGRACGKTTLGRVLAERLGCGFTDTDDLVVESVGMPIAEYVALEGWEAFRDRETEALERAGAMPPLVVSCGGGMVLRPRNRGILRSGLCVYLHAPAEVLAARLAADPKESQRPSLTGKGLLEEVSEVLATREKLYRECASVVLDADSDPETLLDLALAAIRSGS